MAEYMGEERRHHGRREEDHCGSHAVCVANFTNAIEGLTRKITVICKWREDHESEKEDKMDQIRQRFRKVEESVHEVETTMIEKTQAVKDWLNTRVILLLAGLVINMLLVIVTTFIKQ